MPPKRRKINQDKEATLKKVADIEQKLCDMGLKSAADLYRKGVMETLTYLDFPDGESALMLVCARLRHIASCFSLDLMLEQTLRYFCEKPLTLPRVAPLS